MVKEVINRYVCDSCKKEVIIKENEDVPFEEGWLTLKKIEGKVATETKDKRDSVIMNYKAENKDFCSHTCEFAFIGNLVKSIKKMSKDEAMAVESEEISVASTQPVF